MIIHAGDSYIHVDSHAHTHPHPPCFSLYLYCLFIVCQNYRFPILALIPQLSPGSLLQISICAHALDLTHLNYEVNTTTLKHVYMYNNTRQGRRVLNIVELHYCRYMFLFFFCLEQCCSPSAHQLCQNERER